MNELLFLKQKNGFSIFNIIKEFVFPVRTILIEQDKKITLLFDLITNKNFRILEDHEQLLAKQYLVNFKNRNFHKNNDPLPATIIKYNGPTAPHLKRLYIKWNNGWSCVSERKDLNIFEY